MSLTVQEIIEDIAPAADLVDSVGKAIAGLPPKDQRNAADYAKAFGFGPDTPGMKLAVLIDKVEGQLKS